MRRLLLLVSVIALVDTMLYAALVPLLPRYADEYHLSKTGAGLLTAAFGAGTLAGSLPSGIAAARFGPKHAVLAGLTLMSAASLGFAFAGSAWMLGVTRLLQGFGSALTWSGGLTWLVAATPRQRRGEILGVAIGAAVFGALLGPVLGATADLVGTRSAFAAVAALGAALLAWSARTGGVPAERQPLRALARALGEERLLGGLWLMLLPALLFGVLVVLVPLELGAAGWSAVAIGAVFLGGAAFEVVLNPLLGRFSDRRGRLLPVRLALAGSLGVSAALAWATSPAAIAALVIVASLAYGAFYAPSTALVSDSAERAGLAQGLAFGLINAAWAAGNSAGPAAGGALASLAGDATPYLIMAGACLVTLVAVERTLRGPGRLGRLGPSSAGSEL